MSTFIQEFYIWEFVITDKEGHKNRETVFRSVNTANSGNFDGFEKTGRTADSRRRGLLTEQLQHQSERVRESLRVYR